MRDRYVILARNPVNDIIVAVHEGHGEHLRIAAFATENEADDVAAMMPMCQMWPYTVVRAP